MRASESPAVLRSRFVLLVVDCFIHYSHRLRTAGGRFRGALARDPSFFFFPRWRLLLVRFRHSVQSRLLDSAAGKVLSDGAPCFYQIAKQWNNVKA